MKFGVLQFPGSCDEVDALAAARRVGEAELIWHGERDLRGADAIVVPGGFSYGDYLRAGAIARFSPAMESVISFAERWRAGARHLQRLSGALRGAAAARCTAAERQPALHLQAGAARRRRRRDRLHARMPGRAAAEHPRQALLGALLRRPGHARRDRGLRPGGAPLRGRGELQRLPARHRRRPQRAGQRVRPDAPPRARSR